MKLGAALGALLPNSGAVLVTSQVSLNVANGPTVILAANTSRVRFLLQNMDPAQTIFIGYDGTLTTANGFPLFSRDRSEWIDITDDIYAVVDGGAAVDLRILELRTS